MNFQRFVIPILALPRWAKIFVVLMLDTALCITTVWLAYYLRLGDFINLSSSMRLVVAVSIVLALPIFVSFVYIELSFATTGGPHC